MSSLADVKTKIHSNKRIKNCFIFNIDLFHTVYELKVMSLYANFGKLFFDNLRMG